jgi:electron transfer flavoprotein beta subunit
MMAKKKPIETLSPAELGVATEPRLRLLKMAEPSARSPGKRVASVEELLDKLRTEAKVVP